MLFCSIVSFCIVKAGLVQPVDGMTLDVYKVLRPRSLQATMQQYYCSISCPLQLQLTDAAQQLRCLQTAIVPIAGAFAIVLWLGNAAYMYLSVSFIQMLKVRHSRCPVNLRTDSSHSLHQRSASWHCLRSWANPLKHLLPSTPTLGPPYRR
jgi:hypothetical protein